MARPIVQVPLTASPGEILKACVELILKHGPYYHAGICLNLSMEMSIWMQSSGVSSPELKMLSRAVMDLFKRLSSVWPNFSGDHCFPVPCPGSSLNPQEAYDRENKWEGEYGDLRRNLLEFVREHATDDILPVKKLTPCADIILVDLTALSTPAQILAACTAVLLRGYIPNKIAGICGNVANLIDEGFMYRTPYGLRGVVHSLFDDIAAKWPSFSGDRQYPVPHESLNPEDAYNDLDLWEDEYGDTRRSLLEFVHSQALALAGGVAARDPYWLDSAIRLKG